MKYFLGFLVITLFIFTAQNVKAQAAHNLERNDLNNVRHDKNFLSNNFDYTNQSKITQPYWKSNHFKGLSKKRSSISSLYLPDTLILSTLDYTMRYCATYDEEGSITKQLVQVWYNGYWVNYLQDIYSYANGSSLDLLQKWTQGQWINSTLDSSTYDVNGNMLVHTFRYWYQNAWRDSIFSIRTYDENGNMLSNLGKYMKNGNWENWNMSTYTYDGNGNQLTYLLALWSSNAWENSSLNISTYDENGDMLTLLEQYWQDNQWKNGAYVQFNYYDTGKPITILWQVWSGVWVNSSLGTYTYDSDGYLINLLNQDWQNNSWGNTFQTIYTNDSNGNIIHKLRQYWLSGTWSNNRQSNYTYDTYNNELTGNNYQWINNSWQLFDDSFVIKFNGDNYYFTGDSINISYVLLNINEVVEDNNRYLKNYSLSQNYPNPFNPITRIKYSIPASLNPSKGGNLTQLKIFDILGREVATLVNKEQSPGEYEVEFDSGKFNLSSGVYFYKLKTGDFIQTKKMILMK